ncbi:helix-turn-helix domain-containing protein [Rhodococcus hoagii]|nr:helix-turn-helix domain-containing protein [Prescottella equi]
MSGNQDGKESNQVPAMDEQTRRAFAAKIKPARVAAGLQQEELAEMAGVSRRTIGNIERGKVVPQAEVLWKLMTALDLTPHPADDLPDWVDEYVQIIAPLIMAIEQPRRSQVMREVIFMLGRAAGEGRGGPGNSSSSSGEGVNRRSAGENLHAASGALRVAILQEDDPAALEAAAHEVAALAEDLATRRGSSPQVADEIARAADALGFD